MIIALAGRRIDAADATEERFPLRNVELVREQVRELFETEGARAVVCSAACGADLIALEEAGSLELRRRVVLPFSRERFRKTSVTDRPGDWAALYDTILDEVEAAGELVLLDSHGPDDGYAAANGAILDEAVKLAQKLQEPVSAALVWNGRSRGSVDVTERFGIEARKRGLTVIEVRTL